jgi:hypothetical protein
MCQGTSTFPTAPTCLCASLAEYLARGHVLRSPTETRMSTGTRRSISRRGFLTSCLWRYSPDGSASFDLFIAKVILTVMARLWDYRVSLHSAYVLRDVDGAIGGDEASKREY